MMMNSEANSWREEAGIQRRRAERAEAQVAAVKAEALREARDDIKARIVTFRSLDTHPEYMNALNDAWGLVANRHRAALDTPADTPTERCRHGEPEGNCPSCAACAACRGECGVCPYTADTPTEPDADEREAAYRQADDQCRGPRWPKSARPAE